jgi:hypothetical protein
VKTRHALLVLAMSATLGGASAAANVLTLSPPGAGAWRTLDFPKIARHTTYSVVRDHGVDAFKADADCSASARYLPLHDIDLQQTPRLQWRWKVERGLPPHDEREKAGDDFAARVYVLFQFDPRHASLWDRLRHRVGRAWYGDVVPGNALCYVWASREAPGTGWKSPYGIDSQLIALGSGPLPEWTEETADVAADYRAAFGHAPPPIVGIAVMTDTDNTCQQAVAYYAGLQFVSK